MSTTVTIIVIVVVVLVVAGLAVALSRRRTAQRREHAGHLRTEAAAQSEAIDSSQRDAAAAEARAEVARAEAERAEQDAAQARQGLHVEEARQEDSLRAADAIDPDVDHRADDYRPGAAGSREP
ncbi:hypothetical protein GCM10009795_022760 [Nocardioides hankookensis]|uniref:Uncharacterized protein n=1 Tax=Nocardioides hankookensis TaxID=443157 RepID=A0ABW1LFZ4_9ACTN